MVTGRTAKLTKPAVDRARPEPRRYIIWDIELKGFGLRVEPSGHKTFLARYRAGGGRTGVLRQTTLGRYGNVTLDQARISARKVLGAAASGADPVGQKKEARQAGLTIAEVCDWYLEQSEVGRLLGRRGRPIKASTLALDRSRIDRHVKPLVGSQRAKTFTVASMEAFQADIAAGKSAAVRTSGRGGNTTGGVGAASRTTAMLNAILEHAARQGVIPENYTRGARKLAGKRRTVRLTLDQIRKLGAAMRGDTENVTGLAAIRLMLLTGFRRQEVLGIQPAWILDAGGVSFPDTKSGAQVRPIGGAALATLKAQREKVGRKARWIFPADRGEGHFIGVVKVLDRLCQRADLTGVTPHVLRHTFASVAGELGYSELTIAGLLGHSAKGVTAGYVHLDHALVAAADRVSGVIAAALDGTAGAEVVAIDSRRGEHARS